MKRPKRKTVNGGGQYLLFEDLIKEVVKLENDIIDEYGSLLYKTFILNTYSTISPEFVLVTNFCSFTSTF